MRSEYCDVLHITNLYLRPTSLNYKKSGGMKKRGKKWYISQAFPRLWEQRQRGVLQTCDAQKKMTRSFFFSQHRQYTENNPSWITRLRVKKSCRSIIAREEKRVSRQSRPSKIALLRRRYVYALEFEAQLYTYNTINISGRDTACIELGPRHSQKGVSVDVRTMQYTSGQSQERTKTTKLALSRTNNKNYSG